MYARRFEILEKEKWFPVRSNVIKIYRLWSGNQHAVSIVNVIYSFISAVYISSAVIAVIV